MLLRRLEAYGFKSFAEKTELEFDTGITAIVGPNGSGKSNISDAIRWALGEQSIRTLRGSKAEDIIFAGSARRKALGVAEVSLVFDNSDNLLPIDFNEVIITRRIFRSGDSEYYINKSPCRLKDIHELLADTGLGRDSMSVIGQNKVDEVLNSKPEERRAFFEEAAGITKYKHRKREALRKMEETAGNLNRVTDLITEIETQLEPMAENAERTRTFRFLHAELTAAQATLLLNRLSKAEKMVSSALLEKEELTDREIGAGAHIASIEAEKEKLTHEMVDLEAALTHADTALNEVHTDIERIEAQKAVLEERIRQAKRSEERLLLEQERLAEQQKQAARTLEMLQGTTDSETVRRLALTQELERLTADNEHVVAETNKLTQQIESGKDEAFAHLQRLTDARNELRSTERELERLQLRRINLEKEYKQYEEQLLQVQAATEQINSERQALASSRALMDQSSLLLDTNKQELSRKRQGIAELKQQLSEKLQESSSRFKIISHMQQDYEGFSKGIKQLLKTQHSWRGQVCGAVAELFSVPDTYVVAIETALGGALQHMVVEDEETAKQAIRFLKSGNLGRATFLPLTTIRPNPPRDKELQAAASPGAIGFAAELIDCDPKYYPVRDFLLGRIVVAQNIEAALRIARQHSFSLRIVTLDGQQVNPGGSLTGGSIQRRENSFLSRRNELDSLQREIAALRQRWTAAKEQDENLLLQYKRLEQQVETLRIERQEWEVRQAELTVSLEKIHSDRQRIQQLHQALLQELELNEKEQTGLKETANALMLMIEKLESHDSQFKDQVRAWQQQLIELQNTKENYANQITDCKVALAGLEQRMAAVSNQCRQYEQQLADLKQQEAQQTMQLELTRTEIADSNREIEELGEKRKAAAEQQEAVQLQRKTLYHKKLDLLALIQKLERDMRDSRRKYSELQARLHEMQLMATKYELEIVHCQEQLEQMALSREQAAAMLRPGSPEELAAEVKKREMEIAALGPINPNAVEEYERLAERYRFLRQQRDDLVAARDYLVSIIKDIDTTMSKQFTTAFDVINEKFGHIFSRLFGGGHASLEMLDPDNILESGIEISVQPPGKKKQNLALLSGGERALTVIALLFSFLAYRPAPFCVVDEIDAALDEANVQRFSDFLKDFARNTQFIVVTHRKGTMEAADVMLGVTMEESGVSRLLSVKFMDKAV